MVKEYQVASFEGGNLHVLSSDEGGREVVLGLPLNRLIVKMVKVPADADPVEFSTPLLQTMSPYPDEPLTVSCELVRETGEGRVMIAAAMPETPADDIGEALDAARLSVVRLDALVFGDLRTVWNAINVAGEGRKLLLVQEGTGVALVALDADQPSALRAITDLGDLKREVTLSLLEAEDFGGAKKLDEIVWLGEGLEGAVAGLAGFAPVRRLGPRDLDAALAGVGERTSEAGCLNVLPASWREVLDETRFKSKMFRRLAVAGGIWAFVMAVFFAVPAGFGFLTDRQKDMCKRHAKQYQAVKDKKAKVDLVRKYSDHARGALEIMKAVSDRLPAGIELRSWDFKRDTGVWLDAEAEESSQALDFKDKLAEMGVEAEGDEPVFQVVNLGPLSGKAGRKKFKIDCQYKVAEE